MWGGESEEEGEGDCEAPHGEVRLREPGVTSTIYTDQAGCGFGQTTRAGDLSLVILDQAFTSNQNEDRIRFICFPYLVRGFTK